MISDKIDSTDDTNNKNLNYLIDKIFYHLNNHVSKPSYNFTFNLENST